MEKITLKMFKKAGAKGGRATMKKYGRDHFSDAGKKGAIKRWGKKKQKFCPHNQKLRDENPDLDINSYACDECLK